MSECFLFFLYCFRFGEIVLVLVLVRVVWKTYVVCGAAVAGKEAVDGLLREQACIV